MTTAFAALLLGVAVAALLLALAAYWWVNRTPPADERFDAYGRVPLFAVNLTPRAPMNSESDAVAVSDGDAMARPIVRASRTAEDVMADRPAPVGNPVAVDTSALDAAAENRPTADRAVADHFAADRTTADSATANRTGADRAAADQSIGEVSNGTRSSYAPPIAPPALPPKPAPLSPRPEFVDPPARPARIGWGATPGWPVDNGMAATPKYVPPIKPEVDPNRASTPAPFTGNGNGVSADGVPGSMIEGHQLRFTAPTEGTLQFLPGRLEITTGLDTGREIRFVRVPGPNGTEVTFGRNEGPLYRHIQLRDQTVSREHARLLFAEGRWVLTNLSRTNPVAHNGRILRWAEEQPLTEGDRLEMGEVVFNFRSR